MKRADEEDDWQRRRLQHHRLRGRKTQRLPPPLPRLWVPSLRTNTMLKMKPKKKAAQECYWKNNTGERTRSAVVAVIRTFPQQVQDD